MRETHHPLTTLRLNKEVQKHKIRKTLDISYTVLIGEEDMYLIVISAI